MNSLNKYKREDVGDPFLIKSGEHKKVEGISYRKMWTEDSFVLKESGREMIGKTFDFSKIAFIFYALFIFLSVIIGRLIWLQIIKGDYYYSMAEGNRIRIERIESKRGVIYDRNKKPLSRNVANFLLYFIPSDMPKEEAEVDRIINEISGVLGDKSTEEIKSILAEIKPNSLEAYQPLFIDDNIEYEKAMLLILKATEWPGIVLSNKSRREYDLCLKESGCVKSMSHIIGYTGKISPNELKEYGDAYLPIDYIGKMGIESFWESDMRGINGKKQIEVDALGKEKKIINEVKPEDGNNLVLSIDIDLQKKIEDVVSAALEKYKLTKASAVALDPNNGEVLALVSWPTYDNNSFAKGISAKEYNELLENPDKPLYNRSVSGEFPSGSTIKPVMAAAALEEGIITENTSFLSVGGIRIGEWFFPDWKAGGHGQTSVRKAIAESVNTFFYYIGGGYQSFIGLGVDRIIKYEKLFGLGSQTGIDLPGEADGFLPTKKWKEETKGENWYIGDTYHLSIGQGDLLATPLQVALYTSVFANKGKLYRPHIVKEILSNSDELVREIGSELVRENFINNYNIKVVREGMRQTVTGGSARSLNDLPIEAAGKTGTAQWSTKKDPHAWFTGFAPYNNAEIVLTVLVEEGKEGSTVSVPIAREILNWYFTRNNPAVEN